MLRAMLAIGVQTWGTDVAALRHYWTVADELGYARITYGRRPRRVDARRVDDARRARRVDPACPHRPGGDVRVRRVVAPSLVVGQARGNGRPPVGRAPRPAPGRGRGGRCGRAKLVEPRDPLSAGRRENRGAGGGGRARARTTGRP